VMSISLADSLPPQIQILTIPALLLAFIFMAVWRLPRGQDYDYVNLQSDFVDWMDKVWAGGGPMKSRPCYKPQRII
jgi:hypothetical protein